MANQTGMLSLFKNLNYAKGVLHADKEVIICVCQHKL